MAKFSSNNQLMVSVFNNIWDTDNENLTKICDVKTILDIIRTGDYGVAAKINAIRSALAKEQRDELKKHLFVITWQGIFSRKNNNGCESLSSLVCIDIDHQAGLDLNCIKQTISSWPFVLAYFLSPSGDGLKVVIITDNYSIDDYGNCYRQVEQLFSDAFGIQPDSRCEDLSHPCVVRILAILAISVMILVSTIIPMRPHGITSTSRSSISLNNRRITVHQAATILLSQINLS